MVCKVQLLIRISRAALKEIQTHQNCCFCCFTIFCFLFSLLFIPLFLSFFPLDEDHAVSFYFVHLPRHFLKQQEFRSQGHLCEFRWKQQGCLRELGVFLPTHCHTWSTICQVPGLVADLGLAAKRCSSPSLSLTLGQHGRKLSLLGTKEKSLLETKENTWRGAQGGHGAQLKHRGPAAQAPSHTQPVLDRTVKKWELLCSCLLQQEPYPGSPEVCGGCWLVTRELREQLVRKK